MTRINLAKYGFIRTPENDYSDDGSRFQTYKVGNKVQVSKHVSEGEVYLSGNINSSDLAYDVYSQLPHYGAAEWKYNGVSLSTLTEEDLQNFYDACVAYEKEWDEAVANLVLPTEEELTEAISALEAFYTDELAKVKLVISENLEKLFAMLPHEYSYIREYYRSLEKKANISYSYDMALLVNHPGSVAVIKDLREKLKTHSFYFTQIMKLFNTNTWLIKNL